MSEAHDASMPVPARGSGAVLLALILLGTALWLPWWAVTVEVDGETSGANHVRLFSDGGPITRDWAPVATGILAAAVAVLLAVRWAAKSAVHEPHLFRRDVRIAAVALGLALLSCALWPTGKPSFIDTNRYEVQTSGGAGSIETALPGMGWWFALAALAALLWVIWAQRGQMAK